jgi:hypothetical protein
MEFLFKEVNFIFIDELLFLDALSQTISFDP